MGANIHYLELMFILLNIFQPQKLIKKLVDRDLILRRKDKKHQKKNLVVSLLEMILVSLTMQIMKLVKYKHLSVNLKTKNKKITQKFKRTRRQNRKIASSNHSIKLIAKF